MAPMDRRRFLAVTAATAGSLKTFAQGVTETTALPVTKLTLHTDQPGPTVPYNFVGLSYEMEQISVPDFFAPQNEEVIAQFRALGRRAFFALAAIRRISATGSPRRTRLCQSVCPPIPSAASIVLTPRSPLRRKACTACAAFSMPQTGAASTASTWERTFPGSPRKKLPPQRRSSGPGSNVFRLAMKPIASASRHGDCRTFPETLNRFRNPDFFRLGANPQRYFDTNVFADGASAGQEAPRWEGASL